MRGRLWLAGAGLALGASTSLAQFPPPAPLPSSSGQPAANGLPGASALPASRGPSMPISRPATAMPRSTSLPGATALPQPSLLPPSMLRDGSVLPVKRVEMPLPHPEQKIPIDAGTVTVKKIGGSWQVWMGPRPFRNLGMDEVGANDVARVVRALHPNEWVAIGSPRPVVEYGLTDGRPTAALGAPKMVVPIDLRSVRVEALQGVWCLKDAANILFNFGVNKADADQALAVIRKYGFNRVGQVGGDIRLPALKYFYVAAEADGARPIPANPLALAAQEMSLNRTGIAVPGVGYMGEMVKIDPRQVEVRRDGYDWVVAAGNELIARFGRDQSAARDTVRFIQDGQYSEFCRPGPPGLTFFLANGQTPSRVPLALHGRRFDAAHLKVAPLGNRWAVTDHGRHLFDVRSAEEGEAAILLVKHYQFNQLCRLGSSPSASLTFLARAR